VRVDDFVCLGRSVPEASKRYGLKVCMAGYSEEMRGFLRVYPLPVGNPVRQRDVFRLEMERPAQDSRHESWRLQRERPDGGFAERLGSRPPAAVARWLAGKVTPSVSALNAARLSLGVVRPLEYRPFFRRGEEPVDPAQRSLFEGVADTFGPEAARLAPCLRFRDEGGWHELQLREWGCFEWLRKEPGRVTQLWDNLGFGRPDVEHLLLVGNMCNHRNAWLVISTYRQAKQASLFDAAPTPDGATTAEH
jgi:hypothetical protein